MAIDDAYRVFVEQRVRLLASTCDDHARFKATIISQNVAKLPAGAADGMEGAEIFAMFVTGKGVARVTVRPAPSDPFSERKMTLLAITPCSFLPTCIQDLFCDRPSEGRASASSAAAPLLRSCPLQGARRLRSVLATPSRSLSPDCLQPVLQDVASASLALVATWSAAGVAAQSGHRELRALAAMIFAREQSVRAVLYGKGSRCSTANAMPLGRWVSKGQAHCIEGPNVGAREAHTIWSFCNEFYGHLPRTVLFVQDDPQLGTIIRDLAQADWAAQLEASYTRRAAEGQALEPWQPSSCACAPVREAFDARTHGYYRPIAWWMRSFLSPFANRSSPLPTRLLWPATAQFALPRAAIAGRSREFYAVHARLTAVPAPLKRNIARMAGATDAEHARAAREANVGPIVVDLGDAPPASSGFADMHRSIHGYDLAQAFERSWFAAFDPAIPEGRPAYPRCFERDAIALSPLRCANAACPYIAPEAEAAAAASGGCATTDKLGLTSAPHGWRFAQTSARCLRAGCIAKQQHGSSAWMRASSSEAES